MRHQKTNTKSKRHRLQFRTGSGQTWRVEPTKEPPTEKLIKLQGFAPSLSEQRQEWFLTALAAASFCACLVFTASLCNMGIEWLKSTVMPERRQETTLHDDASIGMQLDTPAAKAASLNEQGMKLVGESKYARAIDCFEKAIALDPSLTQAHNNLALTHVQAGDSRSACAVLQNAVTVQPDNRYAASILKMLRPQSTRDQLADTGKPTLF